MFPNDTITVFREFSGVGSVTIATGTTPKTVLAVSSESDGNDVFVTFLCGSDIISKTYGKSGSQGNFDQILMNYKCSQPLTVSKTKNEFVSVNISYLPYFATTSQNTQQNLSFYNPTSTIASTSDIKVYGAISAGELLIAFILLVFAVAGLLSFLARAFGSVKTKKKMIEYSSGDVPIHEEL